MQLLRLSHDPPRQSPSPDPPISRAATGAPRRSPSASIARHRRHSTCSKTARWKVRRRSAAGGSCRSRPRKNSSASEWSAGKARPPFLNAQETGAEGSEQHLPEDADPLADPHTYINTLAALSPSMEGRHEPRSLHPLQAARGDTRGRRAGQRHHRWVLRAGVHADICANCSISSLLVPCWETPSRNTSGSGISSAARATAG